MNKSAVFISYRRDDCAGYAGRLEDALEHALGRNRVFRDVRDIAAGEKFSDVIDASLAQASVTLVLIGPRWAGVKADGTRRIDDPQDFVRMEVASALASTHKVIPVLLSGASLPKTEELPEPLRALTSRQALTLNEASWEADLARLVEGLDMPRPRFKQWLVAGLAALVIAAGAAWYVQRSDSVVAPVAPNPIDATAALTAATTEKLVGSWVSTTDVRYAWGDRYPETLEFKLFAGSLTGTASFLKYPRGIEQFTVNGRNFSFVTHSVESMNNQDRQLTHSFSGELDGDTLHLRLQISGGFTSNPPIEFDAIRQVDAPKS
ncbi:MAG: toll/interleukin-1 receptor domain-containing protein [Steroidobacteraceae bacterium]